MEQVVAHLHSKSVPKNKNTRPVPSGLIHLSFSFSTYTGKHLKMVKGRITNDSRRGTANSGSLSSNILSYFKVIFSHSKGSKPLTCGHPGFGRLLEF